MFQAVPPPIIRSSKLFTHHRVFVELFLLLTACVSELELTIVIIYTSCIKTQKLNLIIGIELEKCADCVSLLSKV